MATEGAYSPKRSDIVLFRINTGQVLNQPATLVTTELTPTVPGSGLLPWWLTHPNSTLFNLQPGIYGAGLMYATLVTAAATNGILSSARTVFKINGSNDSWHRLSLDIVGTSAQYLNTQHAASLTTKLEFLTATSLELETQATIGGNAAITTVSGSHVYFVRYN